MDYKEISVDYFMWTTSRKSMIVFAFSPFKHGWGLHRPTLVSMVENVHSPLIVDDGMDGTHLSL